MTMSCRRCCRRRVRVCAHAVPEAHPTMASRALSLLPPTNTSVALPHVQHLLIRERMVHDMECFHAHLGGPQSQPCAALLLTASSFSSGVGCYRGCEVGTAWEARIFSFWLPLSPVASVLHGSGWVYMRGYFCPGCRVFVRGLAVAEPAGQGRSVGPIIFASPLVI